MCAGDPADSSREPQQQYCTQEPHSSCGSRPKSLGGGSGRRSVKRQTGFITPLQVGALYWLVRLARAAPSTASSGYARAGPSIPYHVVVLSFQNTYSRIRLRPCAGLLNTRTHVRSLSESAEAMRPCASALASPACSCSSLSASCPLGRPSGEDGRGEVIIAPQVLILLLDQTQRRDQASWSLHVIRARLGAGTPGCGLQPRRKRAHSGHWCLP